MTFLRKLAIILTLSISVMTNANASIIKLNDNIELGVLSLDESFVDFYNYSNASSQTGYEKDNALVIFFAEYDNNLALFALADSDKSWGGGTAQFRIDNMADFGSIIFKDDKDDETVANGVNWKWLSKKNDGLIFQLKDANNFDLKISVQGFTGIFNNYHFLSFDENKQVTSYTIDQYNKPRMHVTVVPEPTSIAMLGLALFGLAAARRKA